MALSPPNASNAGLWARQCSTESKDGFNRHPADRDGLYPDNLPNHMPRVCQRGRRHRPIMNAKHPFFSRFGQSLKAGDRGATLNAMRSEIEEAMQLLRRGDDAALEQALSLLQSTVFSFSMRVCGQREDAEDTMQEVLLKSVPHLPKFDNPKALVVWLYKVAKNRCLMSRRRSKFAPKPDLSLEELMPDRKELEQMGTDGSINPEVFAIRSEEAGRLRNAIQHLPPQYRIVLVLRDMEGLTDEEVAEITGLRSGTVRVRLHRARLFVRKELIKDLKLRSGRAGIPARAPSHEPPSNDQPRPARCKAMFAELSNYLDDQLDDSLCEELERHLNGCEPCQAFLASLKATIEQCRRSPSEGPDRQKAVRLRMKVLADYERMVAKNIRQ
jgi:RNA polymerase sigma-70 factor, ECF subfamily